MSGHIFRETIQKSFLQIIIFVLLVLSLIGVSGILIYLVEGKEYGFSSVLFGIYWSFTTAFSLGFGDIVPQTGLGLSIYFFLQMLGLFLIIVPFLILIFGLIEFLFSIFCTVSKE
nr:ion channel [uncultured Methanolobus sp.]